MKYLLLFSIITCYAACLFAQKPPIDHLVYDKWTRVDGIKISSDGNYVVYSSGSNIRSSLIIQTTDTSWKQEIPDVESETSVFTEDNRLVIFLKKTDSLGLMTLKTGLIQYIQSVKSFKISGQVSNQWLAYQLNTPEKNLKLNNLKTGEERTYTGISDYFFSDNGKVLLLQKEIKSDNIIKLEMQWVSLEDNTTKVIWQGDRIDNHVFDSEGRRFAFIERRGEEDSIENVLWIYRQGDDKATELINEQSGKLGTHLMVSNNQPKFSRDGKRLFFQLASRPLAMNPTLDDNTRSLNVWHYKDKIPQPNQLHNLVKYYWAMIQIQNGQIIRLDNDNERIVSDLKNGEIDDWILLVTNSDVGSERHWLPSSYDSVYIISTLDGSRRFVNTFGNNHSPSLSFQNKYILYYSLYQRHYFSYNIKTRITKNITQSIKVPLYDEEGGEELPRLPPSYSYLTPDMWFSEDTALLIYDRYDIWKVDPKGINPPINITNGYGRKHKIVFRLIESKGGYNDLKKDTALLLVAFNQDNKQNGFYIKQLNDFGDPHVLIMSDHLYHIEPLSPESHVHYNHAPIKAVNANKYIVKRCTENEAPNYFSTNDFKTYVPLSDDQPQRTYNWMTAELVKWKMFDGKISQGILYKPENFNPGKKYPLIFYFYEKISDALNKYIEPERADGPISIAYFVSNGYLVFTPDIYFKIGEPGLGTYNSVVSAATYLSTFSWVDAKRMGIQGHSFGGFEVNYLVTATNIFAAASSAAGVSNLITWYGQNSTSPPGYSTYIMEKGQSRIGGTPWQYLERYIKNSPFFGADKVSTPLLMMYGKLDASVTLQQGVEYFTALRRLGKRAWMLEYENAGHQGGGMDYPIRLGQFFDHYLKGAPPPKWMTEGVPARLRGVEPGLDLDTSGRKP